MIRKILNTRVLMGVIWVAFAVTGWAAQDDWSKRTVVTLNRPIEVSGTIIPPGKFIFEIVGMLAERNVVRITSEEDGKIYATVIAIPDYTLEPSDKTVLRFYEAPRGVPEPLRAWFYPDHSIGVEFVYPKKRAVEIARETKEHVLAPLLERPLAPAQVEAPTIEKLLEESLVAITPKGEETPLAEVHPPKPTTPEREVAAAPPPVPPAPVPLQEPALPITASPYPWIGLLGLASAAAAVTTRLLRK